MFEGQRKFIALVKGLVCDERDVEIVGIFRTPLTGDRTVRIRHGSFLGTVHWFPNTNNPTREEFAAQVARMRREQADWEAQIAQEAADKAIAMETMARFYI